VDDIYAEIRNLRRTDETLRRYPVQCVAAGNVPKGGGKFTPRYIVLQHGWRIVPEDVSHVLSVTGEQLTAEGGAGPDCFDLSTISASSKVIIQYEPPAAEVIVISSTPGGDAPTVQEIDAQLSATHGAGAWGGTANVDYPAVADAVRTNLTTELGRIDAAVSSRAAPGAAMALTVAERAAIDTALSAVHGSGVWVDSGAAPDAGQVASAVRAELATELGRVDAAVSTRSSHSAADVNVAVTNAHGAGSWVDTGAAPTASQVATAVRSELTTELGRVDAAVSSRSSHSASDAAAAVRSNLSTELGRMDAAVSTRSAHSPADAASAVRINLAAELGRIDAAVSTRSSHAPADVDAALVVSHGAGSWVDSGAAPAADQVAQAVRSNLVTELARLDAAVSTRSSHTAAGGASAVRSELAAELARLDAAVSTRSSHTALDVDAALAATHGAGSWVDSGAPPSVAQTAAGVRSELALELGRVDAAVSTRSSHTAADAALAVRTNLAAELSRMDAAVSSRAAPGDAMALTANERTALDAALSASHGSDSWEGADALSAQDVAQAVRAEIAAELGRVDVAVSTRSSHMPADVDAALSVSHGAGAWGDASSDPAALAAELDSVLSASHGAGAWGASVDAPTPEQVSAAVWSEPDSNAGAGTMGARMQRLDALVSSRATAGQGLTPEQAAALDAAKKLIMLVFAK
jgi:hypothetical protein